MKDLSTYIELREGEKVVDSRKIHAFLGVTRRHDKWMQEKIRDLSLENGKDFWPTLAKSSGGRNQTIYMINQRAAGRA